MITLSTFEAYISGQPPSKESYKRFFNIQLRHQSVLKEGEESKGTYKMIEEIE